MYFTSFPTHFECIILYYIILFMVKFNLNVFSITFYHHVIQFKQFKLCWIRSESELCQMNCESNESDSESAVQRQVKWTIHHCELPESLNTSFLLLRFFQWLFLSSDSVCPFVLTPRDTTWACVAKDSSDGALVFVCVATWSLHTSLAVTTAGCHRKCVSVCKCCSILWSSEMSSFWGTEKGWLKDRGQETLQELCAILFKFKPQNNIVMHTQAHCGYLAECVCVCVCMCSSLRPYQFFSHMAFTEI